MLKPIVKWAGGKEKELKYIIPNIPSDFVHYYEPFVGGGAVFGAIDAERYFINDKSSELISLYRHIARQDKSFISWLTEIDASWTRMLFWARSRENMVTMYYRYLYNQGNDGGALDTALFLFIRNYAYGGMFRYNADGDFNVPYGGIGYNSKSISSKIEYYSAAELLQRFKNVEICNLDFEDFLKAYPPTEDDFVFLDPPYDSDFSTYAKNEFTKKDQTRLALYLQNECKGKWMLIIKNTPFIYALYSNKGLNIRAFDKTYLVSFMNRNDKKAEHLLITNY